MATVGLCTTYVGIYGPDGRLICDAKTGLSEKGIYEIDTSRSDGNLGATTANITGLSGTISQISGNDTRVDVSVPDPAPSVALTYNQINWDVKQKLLGRDKSNGGYTDGNSVVEAGLIAVSHDEAFGKKVYFAFPRGVFSEASQNIGTNTDSAKTINAEELTFTAMASQKIKNAAGDNQAFKIYFEGDPDFDMKKMFDEVFGSEQKFATASNA